MPHPIRALLNKTISVRALAGVLAIILLAIFASPISNLRADPIDSDVPAEGAVTAAEVGTAISDVDGLAADSDTVNSEEDADSALKTDTAESDVDVPRDASAGVSLTASDGAAIKISLPNANEAFDAKPIGRGMVAYAGKTDSANSVQVTEDGGVRLLNVINSAAAPISYSYELTLPDGYTAEEAEDGEIEIYDANADIAATIEAPWAKDANGKPVETYYSLSGTTITQTIEHRDVNVTYPIVADPKFSFKWYGFNMYIDQTTVNKLIAATDIGAGTSALGAIAKGASAGPTAAIGFAIAQIGTGEIEWCSSKGRGLWIHFNYFTKVSWCNNG